MLILVHSPWLPVYIDVVQTILVVLTLVGIFLPDLVYIFYIFILEVGMNGRDRLFKKTN